MKSLSLLVLFMGVLPMAAGAQTLNETLSGYTAGGATLTGQGSWSTLSGSVSTLVQSGAVAPPGGGVNYLVENGSSNSQNLVSLGASVGVAGTINLSYDLYYEGGTIMMGLTNAAGTQPAPQIEYSGGFEFLDQAGTNNSSGYSTIISATSGGAAQTLSLGHWYRIMSTIDVVQGQQTATLSYETWSGTAWSAATSLYFSDTGTTAENLTLTSGQVNVLNTAILRIANNSTDTTEVTNLTITAAPEPSSLGLAAAGAVVLFLSLSKRMCLAEKNRRSAT